MKKTLALAVTAAFLATPAFSADVKIGVLLGFTGPIESLTPDMASGAELAMKEASDSSAFMGGSKLSPFVVTQLVLMRQQQLQPQNG